MKAQGAELKNKVDLLVIEKKLIEVTYLETYMSTYTWYDFTFTYSETVYMYVEFPVKPSVEVSSRKSKQHWR